jgi:hypothetical protein
MICKCYTAEKNFLGKVGTCWGTAERDACSCGGDKSKCDFYPNVREAEKKPITNADRIRAMSDEELAEYLDGVCHDLWQMFVKDPQKMWLDWLRQEATE